MARETIEGAPTQMEQGTSATVRPIGARIIRRAEDERQHDVLRLRAAEVEAWKAELVRVHGQRLFDELRTTLVRDIDGFRDEFPLRGSQTTTSNGISHGHAQLAPAPISCKYQFPSTNAVPPGRSVRLHLHQRR